MQKHKNMLTHMIQVRFRPFQRRSLVFYQFAVVGTQEDVVGTITGGERAWEASEMAGRFFSMSLAAMVVRKAVVDGWMG
jgi:hypothetical protein